MSSKNQIFFAFCLYISCSQVIQAGFLDGRTEPFTREEGDKIIEAYNKECNLADITKDPVTDRDSLESLMRKGKCAHACFYRMLGITTEDNRLNEENVKVYEEMERKIAPDVHPKYYEKCSHITDENSCEYGYKIHNCLMSE